MLFFFKQKTAYEMRISDWSSYVCSSDLPEGHLDFARCERMIQGSLDLCSEAQEGNRLRRGQDDRHAVLRLKDFAVEDDVRPFALDTDLVALLKMHAFELLLPQRHAPGRAEHAEQRADAAVGREQFHRSEEHT